MIQDYGFRLYNPAIGKFLSVDPLAPDYPSWGPYAFAMNRVIDGVDLDGLEHFSIHELNQTKTEAKLDLVSASGPLLLTHNGRIIPDNSNSFQSFQNWYESGQFRIVRGKLMTDNLDYRKVKSAPYAGHASSIPGTGQSFNPIIAGNFGDFRNRSTAPIRTLTPSLIPQNFSMPPIPLVPPPPPPVTPPITPPPPPPTLPLSGTLSRYAMHWETNSIGLIDARKTKGIDRDINNLWTDAINFSNANLLTVAGSNGGITPNEVTSINLYFENASDQTTYGSSINTMLTNQYPNATINQLVNSARVQTSVTEKGETFDRKKIMFSYDINYTDQ